MNDVIQNVLNVINEVYEQGECRINEILPAGERGDCLADYIAFEVREACAGYEQNEVKEIALRALCTGLKQLQEVIDAIEKMD